MCLMKVCGVPPTSSILSSNSKRAILNFQKHSDVIKGCSYAFDAFNDNFKHLLKCATLYDVELRECSVCNISVSLRYFIFLRQNGNLMRLWKSFPINILLTIFLQSWMMLKRREIAKKGPKIPWRHHHHHTQSLTRTLFRFFPWNVPSLQRVQKITYVRIVWHISLSYVLNIWNVCPWIRIFYSQNHTDDDVEFFHQSIFYATTFLFWYQKKRTSNSC